MGRYGHQCRQGDKHAVTKTPASKCCNLPNYQMEQIYDISPFTPQCLYGMTFPTVLTRCQVWMLKSRKLDQEAALRPGSLGGILIAVIWAAHAADRPIYCSSGLLHLNVLPLLASPLHGGAYS